MAEASIPVDLFNPGQVFACLGFMEAAELLLGDAEGGFDWSNPGQVRFRLSAKGAKDPVRAVLGFLAAAKLVAVKPAPPRQPLAISQREAGEGHAGVGAGGAGSEREVKRRGRQRSGEPVHDERAHTVKSPTFPAPRADEKHNALPVRITGKHKGMTVDLTHWWDKSGRTDFKLYSGNRSALKILRDMQALIKHAWSGSRAELITAPFDLVVAMGGSLNLDPRGAWTALDAGYSPNDQDHQVQASPVVEFLAAWGLENSRPQTIETRRVDTRRYAYAAWGVFLPTLLARAAMACVPIPVPTRRFAFNLPSSGKNKIVTFAEEENSA